MPGPPGLPHPIGPQEMGCLAGPGPGPCVPPKPRMSSGSGMVRFVAREMRFGAGHSVNAFPTHVTTGLNWECQPGRLGAPPAQCECQAQHPATCPLIYKPARACPALYYGDEPGAMGETGPGDCAAGEPQNRHHPDGTGAGPPTVVFLQRSQNPPLLVLPRSPSPVLINRRGQRGGAAAALRASLLNLHNRMLTQSPGLLPAPALRRHGEIESRAANPACFCYARSCQASAARARKPCRRLT